MVSMATNGDLATSPSFWRQTKIPQSLAGQCFQVARLAGFEPATYGLEVRKGGFCNVKRNDEKLVPVGLFGFSTRAG